MQNEDTSIFTWLIAYANNRKSARGFPQALRHGLPPTPRQMSSSYSKTSTY